MEQWELLAVATRGGHDESEYRGAIAVVDANGRLLYAAGNPAARIFARSALKPLQALPTVAHAHAIGLSDEEIALMCASHSGEPVHVERVARLLARMGCGPDDLQCGRHAPLYLAAGDPPPPAGITPLHHNCSGKHSGFLAYCRHAGLPTRTYLDPEHPLQRQVRAAISRLAGVDEDDLVCAIDGCSAPTYALPLLALACAYARLACAEAHDPAARHVFGAMSSHPYLVAGHNRADTFLMERRPADLIAKGGAEGVQAVGCRSRRIGIAIKIADGNGRAASATAAAVLRELGLLEANDLEQAPPSLERTVRNACGIVTGELEVRLRLRRA